MDISTNDQFSKKFILNVGIDYIVVISISNNLYK